MLLVAVVFAAACGVTVGISDAATPGTWRVTVVGAVFAVVPAVVVVVFQLSAGPNRVIVALAMLAVVFAGGLGAVLGGMAARRAWADTVVPGAALVWWLGQVARRVFIAVAGPRPPVNGQLTDAFLRSAALTTRWAPVVLGVACAVAVILLGVLIRRTGRRGSLGLGVLPAVVWTVAETLAAVPLGGGALLDAPWWAVLCCLAGGALGAGTGRAARTLRPGAR